MAWPEDFFFLSAWALEEMPVTVPIHLVYFPRTALTAQPNSPEQAKKEDTSLQLISATESISG